jgi:hypothetical protein
MGKLFLLIVSVNIDRYVVIPAVGILIVNRGNQVSYNEAMQNWKRDYYGTVLGN